MKFKYVAFNKEGKKVKGEIEASSIQEAQTKLNDLIIIKIKPKKFNFSFYTNKKEIAKILNVLGLYLRASIPLKRAIQLAKNQTEDTKIKKFLDFIEEEIKNGKSLSQAISSQKIINLAPFITNSIKVAEKSSNLDTILIELSKFLQEEEKISSKTTQALIYPSFIILSSFILVIVMMNTIVPKIVKIFENLNQKLPAITQITISISKFIQNNYIFIFLMIIVALLILTLAYKKTYLKNIVHKIVLKIPILNSLIILKNLTRLLTLTLTLVKSGINFIDSIILASNTIDNLELKKIINKALKDVKEGKRLSSALYKYSFPDKSFIDSIALIEDTAKAKEILENLKEIYLQEYNNKISIFLSLLEPMMILIVGAMVGFIVISMLLPIFSMSIN